MSSTLRNFADRTRSKAKRSIHHILFSGGFAYREQEKKVSMLWIVNRQTRTSCIQIYSILELNVGFANVNLVWYYCVTLKHDLPIWEWCLQTPSFPCTGRELMMLNSPSKWSVTVAAQERKRTPFRWSNTALCSSINRSACERYTCAKPHRTRTGGGALPIIAR